MEVLRRTSEDIFWRKYVYGYMFLGSYLNHLLQGQFVDTCKIRYHVRCKFILIVLHLVFLLFSQNQQVLMMHKQPTHSKVFLETLTAAHSKIMPPFMKLNAHYCGHKISLLDLFMRQLNPRHIINLYTLKNRYLYYTLKLFLGSHLFPSVFQIKFCIYVSSSLCLLHVLSM